MAKSISKWTLNPATLGISLDDLVMTQLPPWEDLVGQIGLKFSQPPFYKEQKIDDFSPLFDESGTGNINIVPFSGLNDIIQNGDVIVFMERQADLHGEKFFKQRGWHAEIAFRNNEGEAVQCAPYGCEKNIIEHKCSDLINHRWYRSENYKDISRWNLHIFRIDDKTENTLRLLTGVRCWRRMFDSYVFPPDVDWALDPADFSDINELETIACNLIRGNMQSVPMVTCVQWVMTVLSLALNVPLNKSTLSRLHIAGEYSDKWAATLGFVDDDVKPLGYLPITPYSPEDLIVSICRTYLNAPDNVARPIIQALATQGLFQNDQLKRIPSHMFAPISPFSEYRKPGHRGNLTWEYVASTFPDPVCMPQ